MGFDKFVKRDMYLIYQECRGRAKTAHRLYAERYPDRTHPSEKTFKRTAVRFEQECNFEPKQRIRRKIVSTEDNQINILAYLEAYPRASVRDIVRGTGISRSTISRIIKTHKMHPFKARMAQEILPNDLNRRITFCNWFLNMYNRDAAFPLKVLWTDEAKFCKNGAIYTQIHYYSTQNPKMTVIKSSQRQWSVNVWCGIIGDVLLGPYFYQDSLTGERYLHFLQHVLDDMLDNLPLNRLNDMYFQQDGAPAHNHRIVKEYLVERFGQRLITTNCLDGLSNWPARSPDLTPMDFFLWGYLKSEVYKTPCESVEEMQRRLRELCRSIDPNILLRTTMNVTKRARICVQQNGGHFENVL